MKPFFKPNRKISFLYVKNNFWNIHGFRKTSVDNCSRDKFRKLRQKDSKNDIFFRIKLKKLTFYRAKVTVKGSYRIEQRWLISPIL